MQLSCMRTQLKFQELQERAQDGQSNFKFEVDVGTNLPGSEELCEAFGKTVLKS